MPELSLTLDVLTRLVFASVLGGLIGFERDKHGRAAGLRTHLLVSLGAASFMIMSINLPKLSNNAGFVADPARIAAQIVTGIGFLGAGVILKHGVNVRGLTTAACLWVAAAIGMASGSADYLLATLITALALLALVFLKYLEGSYYKDSYRTLRIVTPLEHTATEIIDKVKQKNLKVINCDIHRNYDMKTTTIRLSLRLKHNSVTDKLAHGIIRNLEQSDIELKEVYWDKY